MSSELQKLRKELAVARGALQGMREQRQDMQQEAGPVPLPGPGPEGQGGGADRAGGEGQVGGSLEEHVQAQLGAAGPLQPTILSYESLKKGNSSTMVAGEGTAVREISSKEFRVSCVTLEEGSAIGPTRGRLSMYP